MKKKATISVKDLKVSSFVTNNEEAKQLKGGFSIDNTACVNCNGHCFKAETCECYTEGPECF